MIGIAYNVSSPVQRATQELLDRCLDDARVADICARICDAQERHLAGLSTREEYHTEKANLKKGLPIITPHATFGPSGRRVNAEAVPTGLFMMDYDDVNNPVALYHDHIASLVDAWGVVFAARTPGGGLRVIATIPPAFRQSMTPELAIAAAQMSFADACGLRDYDQACKDLARCSFLVPRVYVYYIDTEKLLAEAEPWPELPIPEGYNESPTNADESTAENDESTAENGQSTGESGGAPECCDTYEGLKYAAIISEWFNQEGGEPQQGERNTKLHQLACNLRAICHDDAQLLLRIMPDYGLSEGERKALIASALKGKCRGVSAAMKRVLRTLHKLDDEQTEEPMAPPPPMPERLPELVALLLKPIPAIYQPAVAHAIFPSLAVHLWKTRFPYADNILHECTLMNVLLAETGAGKDCISMPINLIMQDIRERDRENLRREAEWKREMSTKSANADKSQRPAGLVIQEIDPDVTNAAFVMRLHEAEDHFLYTRMNEIDQFDALRGNGRTGQQFQIMCLNFDPDNQYGQTRVGWNSVTEKVQVRFNWNASSTLVHGKNYFSRVVLNGPISRINFCTIPQRPLGASIPRYGRYSSDDKIAIKTYIDRLCSTTGIISDPRLSNLANALIEHCNTQTILSQDRIYENLSFRACVIAWLKICLLFVANGMKWEECFQDFALWSLDYDLHCKMAFFGDLIANAQHSEKNSHVYQARNLLELLPTVFNRAQATAIRKLRGKSEDPSNMLYMWKQRNHIIQTGEDTYQKI